MALYKELTDVESGFRQLRMCWQCGRSITDPVAVKAHIFVVVLALLVERLLGRRLKEAGVDLLRAGDGGIVDRGLVISPGGPSRAPGRDRGLSDE